MFAEIGTQAMCLRKMPVSECYMRKTDEIENFMEGFRLNYGRVKLLQEWHQILRLHKNCKIEWTVLALPLINT